MLNISESSNGTDVKSINDPNAIKIRVNQPIDNPVQFPDNTRGNKNQVSQAPAPMEFRRGGQRVQIDQTSKNIQPTEEIVMVPHNVMPPQPIIGNDPISILSNSVGIRINNTPELQESLQSTYTGDYLHVNPVLADGSQIKLFRTNLVKTCCQEYFDLTLVPEENRSYVKYILKNFVVSTQITSHFTERNTILGYINYMWQGSECEIKNYNNLLAYKITQQNYNTGELTYKVEANVTDANSGEKIATICQDLNDQSDNINWEIRYLSDIGVAAKLLILGAGIFLANKYRPTKK